MDGLKKLGTAYIAVASVYAVAAALSWHPDWARETRIAGTYLGGQGEQAAVALDNHVLVPGWDLTKKEGRVFGDWVATLYAPPHDMTVASLPAKRQLAVVHAAPAVAKPVHVAVARPEIAQGQSVITSPPDTQVPTTEAPSESSAPPQPAVPQQQSADSTPPMRPMELAPQAEQPPAQANPQANTQTASIPPSTGIDPADIIRVEDRLKDSLTREMFENFELFLYVSKADAGPWAQHMYVFKKQASGDLVLLYNWPVSTGREQIEFDPQGQRLVTTTPPGYYELDPNRSYAHYRSSQWGKPMPYAMFFNWVERGNQTGLAIHAASGDDAARLGQRASAGCIHLSEDNARTLFTMIRSQYRGLAPRFAIDRRTGTMSNDGILLHDAQGNLKMADGYKVLVFIENYGGENVVAALF